MIQLTEKQQELLEWAKFYVSKGISIIPVGPDKVPLIPWREFQNRRASPQELEKWWEQYPHAQVGAVTGRISNLSVVDVEDKGDWSFLPQETTISKTGSGGRHYFYQFESSLSNRVRVRELVDIRSEGGYVIMPPSTSSKGSYEWIKQVPQAMFPLHLFPSPEGIQRLNMQNVTSLSLTTDAMIHIIDKWEGSQSGSRNADMTALAGTIMNRTHPLKWDTEVFPALLEANKRNNPPLSEYEIKTVFESIKSKDLANPTSRWIAKEFVPEPEPSEEGDDDIVLMSAAAAAEKINVNKFFPTGLPTFDEALYGGGFKPGDLIVIGAAPGHGKTSMCQSLARNFLLDGHKVLFLSYEVLVQHVWEKFKGMGIDENAFIYSPIKMKGAVDWIEKVVKKSKQQYGTEIIIIDHLGFLLPKANKKGISKMSENYSVYLTSIVRDLKVLAKDEEVVIVMPVHMRKRMGNIKKNTPPDINEIQHSAGIYQESDAVFLMQREETTKPEAPEMFTGYTLMLMAKNRHGKSNPRCYVSLLGDIFKEDKTYYGEQKTDKSSKGKDAPSGGYHEKEERVVEPDPQSELNLVNIFL